MARDDPEQGTPLILAAAQGQTEIVGALLDAGAPVDQADAAGRTALHAACWGGHADAAELLAAAGADRGLRDRSGGSPPTKPAAGGTTISPAGRGRGIWAARGQSRRAAGA